MLSCRTSRSYPGFGFRRPLNALSSDNSQSVQKMLLCLKVKASALLNQAAVLTRDTNQSESTCNASVLFISNPCIFSSIRLILAPSTGSQRQTQRIHPPPASGDNDVATFPEISGHLHRTRCYPLHFASCLLLLLRGEDAASRSICF